MSQVSRQVAQIVGVLEGVGWNVSHAARRLGVHRNTVLTKLSALRQKICFVTATVTAMGGGAGLGQHLGA